MGNNPTTSVHQTLTDQEVESLITEYRRLGDRGRNWDDAELKYLLQIFWSISRDGILVRYPALKKERKRPLVNLEQLELSKGAALGIEVYNQPFSNYPGLFSRFWNVVDRGQTDFCTFVAFSELLFVVARGDWEEKLRHVFSLLKRAPGDEVIRKENVEFFVDEVGEFFSNIARGLITVQDFRLLKCSSIGTMFDRRVTLNYENFKSIALRHQDVVSCALITDMIFGRYYRKLLKATIKDAKSFIFGRSLAEGALGNGRDITGKNPFIPEVLATAFHYLQENGVHCHPELFNDPVNARTALKKEVDKEGKYLFKMLQYQDKTLETFLEVGTFIKLYFQRLPEALFTEASATTILDKEQENITLEQKIDAYVLIFRELPHVNQFVISALLQFLHRVLEQREQQENASFDFLRSFAKSTLRQQNRYSDQVQVSAFTNLVRHAQRFTIVENRIGENLGTPRVQRANSQRIDPLQELEAQIAQVQEEIAELKRRLNRD